MSHPADRTAASHRYSAVAAGLHWLIAGLIIANVAIAWYANALHGLAKVQPFQVHKAIGITILVLSLARLGWRLAFPPPAYPVSMKPWERWLAHVVHWGFYGLMIGLPLSGWIMVSASRTIAVHPIDMFGLFNWPAIGPLTTLPFERMHAVHEVFESAHHLLAKLLVYVLFPLHILGALKHQFIDREDEFARMIPFIPLRRQPPLKETP